MRLFPMVILDHLCKAACSHGHYSEVAGQHYASHLRAPTLSDAVHPSSLCHGIVSHSEGI